MVNVTLQMMHRLSPSLAVAVAAAVMLAIGKCHSVKRHFSHVLEFSMSENMLIICMLKSAYLGLYITLVQ